MGRNVMDADMNLLHHGGDTAVIPEGLYCYVTRGIVSGEDGLPKMMIHACPYWGQHKENGETFGYCAMLKTGDWLEGGTSLLHDMVKECGINLSVLGQTEAREALAYGI